MFQGLPAGRGHYETKLHPYLWNVTASVSSSTPLSLNIVPHGNEPWDTANPTGPIWNAIYTAPVGGASAPDDATPPTGGSFKIIDAFLSAAGGLTKGGMAAAIICPLVVVGVALGLWIRKLHINRNNKTVDWADHMDKRMSRISLDWNNGGDGSAGAVPGSRPASFYPRPSGTYTQGSHPTRMSMAGGAGMAGRGAMMNQNQENGFDGDLNDGQHYDDGEQWGEDPYGGMEDDGEMRERIPRPRGPSMYDEGSRQSRISFAQSTTGDRISRISVAGQSSNDHAGGTARSIGSASAGHKNSASIPRVGQNGNAWRRSAMTTESYYDPDAPAVPKLSGNYVNDNRTSRLSMAFTNADETQDAEEDLDDMGMSPTQHDGPAQLGRGEVDSKMRESFAENRAITPLDDDADREFRASVLKYPALSFMHDGKTGSEGQENDMFDSAVTSPQQESENGSTNYINHGHYAGAHALSPDHPARLAQLAANSGINQSSMNLSSTPASNLPSLNSQTGMAPPNGATSPDEALKQYAALRAAATSPTSMNAAASNGQLGSNSMRTLYTPNSTSTSLNALDGSHGHKQNQLSVAGSSLNEDDVVGYNEMIN